MTSWARRRAWALLSRAAFGPCRPVQELIATLGVEQAAAAIAAGDVPTALDRRILERGASLQLAEQDLEAADRACVRLLTPGEDEWPAELMAGFDAVREMPDFTAPVALWVRGPLSLRGATRRRAIAIVGARRSTRDGNRIAARIATELVDMGWTIVSGAAFGIDAAAHHAAATASAWLVSAGDRPKEAASSRMLTGCGPHRVGLFSTGSDSSEFPVTATAEPDVA